MATVHNLGFPRIGVKRGLQLAQVSYRKVEQDERRKSHWRAIHRRGEENASLPQSPTHREPIHLCEFKGLLRPEAAAESAKSARMSRSDSLEG